MDSKLKERLVGVLVIVFLAIIFIPPMYDGRNPFEIDDSEYRVTPPREPKFSTPEDMANQIADIGSGRLDEIEEHVKEDIPESARSDSLLEQEEDTLSLDDFNASEMTAQLLNDIAERSNLTARFGNKKAFKQAWAVQVGSFTEVARAQSLRDELISKDFQAFIKTVMIDGKEISRVFAGVSLEKAVAEDIQQKLIESTAAENSIVVPYQP